MVKQRAAMPWWLDDGTEICPACKQLYLYETQFRCSDCDGPSCGECVETSSSVTVVTVTCSACVPAKEAV